MPKVWNAVKRRYEIRGKVIKPERIRESVNEVMEASRETLRGFAEAYRTGKINHAQFFVNLNEEITRAHSAIGMIARGGKAQMTNQTWGRVGQLVAVQKRFARQFAASTLDTPASEFPVWRAESYSRVYGQTYDNVMLKREEESGVKQIERVLGAAEKHCPDCPSLAGIYDIDKAPPIGVNTQCGPGCACYFREVA